MSIIGTLAGSAAGNVSGGATSSIVGPAFTALGYVANNAMPVLVPTPADAFWAYRTGWLGWENTKRILSLNGIDWEPGGPALIPDPGSGTNGLQAIWNRINRSRAPQPALTELLVMFNRGMLRRDQVDDRLRKQGFDDKEVRDAFRELAKGIPGPSDLVRFAVREVFDPLVVKRYGYDEEFPSLFNHWMGQQGFGWDVRTPQEKGRGVPAYTWANAYWRAHWQLPSPTQAYEMLHRLRPKDAKTGRPRDPSGEIFEIDDLRTLLKVQDYPVFWRDKLAAMSFRVIGIRQLRDLNRLGQYDLTDLGEAFLDQGYNQRDAATLAQLVVRQNRAAELKASVTGVKGRIVRAYKVGVIEREEAALQLYRASLTDPGKADAFEALTPDLQAQTAQADRGVQLQLDLADEDRDAELAQAVVTGLKRLYLNGHIDRTTAMARLIGAGIVPTRRDQIIDHWDQLLDRSRRELTTAKIQEYARRGILGLPDARTRLINLGWQAQDVNLLLAEVQRNALLDIAKANMAAARTIKQQQQAAKQAAAAARTEHNRARSELARHGSPSQLARWLQIGLIQRPEAFRRLLSLDWPAGDANVLIEEALEKRAKAQAAKQPKGQPATAGV